MGLGAGLKVQSTIKCWKQPLIDMVNGLKLLPQYVIVRERSSTCNFPFFK